MSHKLIFHVGASKKENKESVALNSAANFINSLKKINYFPLQNGAINREHSQKLVLTQILPLLSKDHPAYFITILDIYF